MGNKAADSGSSGEFSGIDPRAMQKMIDSLRKDADQLHTSAVQFKTQFGRYGLDTQPLSDLLGHARWASDQLPALERRHDLATAIDGPHYQGTHLVAVDESLVGKASSDAARKKGKALADRYRAKMDKGDPLPDGCFAALCSGADDGDFVKAFYAELGPQRTSWLAADLSMPENARYEGHPKAQAQDRALFSRTLGTYTQVAFTDRTPARQKAAWTDWFGRFGAGTGKDGFRPDLLMPLLSGGTQSTAFLVALGDKVFDKKMIPQPSGPTGADPMNGDATSPGAWGADHYTQFFDALAEDPEASGEWFDDRHDVADSMLYIPPSTAWQLDRPKSRAAAFFKAAHQATIGLRATNEPLAEKITMRMMYDNYVHTQSSATKNVHPVEGADELYAQIITSRWDDLEYSVTSPVGNTFAMHDITTDDPAGDNTRWSYPAFAAAEDRHRPGLEVAPEVWQALVSESARSPRSAGDLSALFQAYDAEMMHRSDFTTSEDAASNDAAGNYYLSLRRGRMQAFYINAFNNTTAGLGDDLANWTDATNKRRERELDLAYEVGKGGVTGGAAGAADAVKEFGTGWVDDTLLSRLGSYTKVEPKDAPPALKNNFKKVKETKLDFSWQDTYCTSAQDLLSAGFARSRIKPLTVMDPEGRTSHHTGDPHDYISGPADDFLNPDGTAIRVAAMTPRQRAAFSDWAQDPAVANRMATGFGATAAGKTLEVVE